MLVVDDEPSMGRVIENLLRKAYGAEVDVVGQNEDAFRLLKTRRYDLVLSDLMRPGGNGFDFLNRIRQTPGLRTTPVVIQSGNAAKMELSAWRSGATAIIEKPFTVAGLIATVDEVMDVVGDEVAAVVGAEAESPALDFKREIRLSNRTQRAELAKDVIAFANFGGGQMVVGVDEPRPGSFVRVGVSPEQAEALETSVLNRAIRPYLDPPIHISSRRVHYQSRLFVIIDVPGTDGTLVLAARENPDAALYTGRIYVRSSAAESAEVESSHQLRQILARVGRGLDSVK